MTVAFNTLHDVQLGFAAIFLCIGVGFLLLKLISGDIGGPGYWSVGFVSNSLGFLLWSGSAIGNARLSYLAGEILHMIGFFSMSIGAVVFCGLRIPKRVSIPAAAIWAAVWAVSVASFEEHGLAAGISLKLLRALPIASSGLLILAPRNNCLKSLGKSICGASLVVWALFIVMSAFVRINGVIFYGFLAGFQLLAAFGMVAMLVERLHVRADKAEKHASQLEGILPICCYCKKIRDENEEWRILEEYIENRSKAEFSHGICPECFEKHRPDR